METNNFELLDAYLNGTLSPDEQEMVEKRLRTDDAFKADYEIHQLMVTAITENRKAELKTFISKNVKVKSNPFFRSPTFYAAAAASVVLCVISYFVVYKKLAEQNTLAQNESTEVKQETPVSTVPTDTAETKGSTASNVNSEPTVASNQNSNGTTQGIVALDDNKEQIDNRTAESVDNNSNGTMATNPDDIKVESDKMHLDTFLAIPRKIYIAKPKQYQTNANDLYTVVTTGDRLKLEVQFWQSPINYSGYKYAHGLLVIYGNFDPSLTSFQELKSIVYMKYKNDYYQIKANETYTSLYKETDAKVLADLK